MKKWGFKRMSSALYVSSLVNVTPSAVQLLDGTYAGRGESLLNCDGVQFFVLYGPKNRLGKRKNLDSIEARKIGLID
jgi:hypothetical protein